MSGMVSSVEMKSPLRPACASKSVSFQTDGYPLVSYSAGAAPLPVSVTSWRSGAGYSRAMSKNGTEVPMTRGELLSYFGTSDTGHPYLKKDTTAMHSSFFYNRAKDPYHVFAAGSGGEVIIDFKPDGKERWFDPNFSWAMSDATLKQLGTDFTQGVSPLQPVADLFVSIAETLHDGLPKPLASVITKKGIKGRKNVIGSVGNEYLNYIFGIVPLVSDIRAATTVASEVNKVIDQWIRNNHRQVRRRRRLDPKVEPRQIWEKGSSTAGYSCLVNVPFGLPGSSNSDPYGVAPVGLFPNKAFSLGATNRDWQRTLSEVKTTKITFSSAFQYSLENLLLGDDQLAPGSWSDSEIRDAVRWHYYGLSPSDISLSTIWNLTPWSWMMDWFTNIGSTLDYLREMQSVGLQLDWAYIKVVQELYRKIHFEWYGSNAGYVPSDLAIRHDMEFKQLYVRRLKASPFGFNVDFGALSNSQISVVAALAASRVL